MSELRLERHFAIAAAELFAFVTEPGNLVKWWGPEGMGLAEENLDLRRTGPWSLVLTHPAGGTFTMAGTVLAVTPPSLVEFTMNVPGADTDSNVRFEIATDGADGSRLTLIQSGITDEMVVMGQRGWGSTLARLERLIAG